MKSFKHFIKNFIPEPILIPFAPVHGTHSQPKKDVEKEPSLIGTNPVHGAHSAPKRLRELYDPNDDEHIHDHPDHEDKESWINKHDNNHLGKNHVEVHNKIDMKKEEFKKHPGSKYVHSYTDYSHSINDNLLRKAQKKPPAWKENTFATEVHKEILRKEHDRHVRNIDKAVKHKPLSHDLHVYHGTYRFNPGELAAKHPKGHIKTATYMSASLHKKVAHRFSGVHAFSEEGKGHILHIHLKKGQHALYAGSHSEYPKEHETIIPRNTTLKVHHEPTKLKDGTHVWHAHVVDKK